MEHALVYAVFIMMALSKLVLLWGNQESHPQAYEHAHIRTCRCNAWCKIGYENL